jgi:hypothetical protein
MRLTSGGNVLLGTTSATTAPTGYISAANTFGYKNRIINGDMRFWQRGTTFTNPASGGSNFFTADRWAINRAGNATGATVTQSTDVPSGFKYSLKLQRTASNATLEGLYIFNSNESINTLDLAGQTATLSFWAKAGANYSGGALSYNLYYGTGTDQPVYGYTGSTSWAGTTTNTITSTWTRYTLTGTVAANATELGFIMFWTPTGTAGADDSVYFTGFQLEKGSIASSFDYRSYTTEQLLCQRYYHFLGGDTAYQNVVTATYYGAGDCVGPFRYPVEMRISPTISKTGTWTALGGAGAAGQTVSADQKGIKNVQLGFTGGTSGVSGQSTTIRASNDSTFRITFDAEL